MALATGHDIRNTVLFEIGDSVKPLEAPRVSLVWGGLGTLLFLTLGAWDLIAGAPVWRAIGNFVLAIGAIYLFVRALVTVLGKSRPES